MSLKDHPLPFKDRNGYVVDAEDEAVAGSSDFSTEIASILNAHFAPKPETSSKPFTPYLCTHGNDGRTCGKCCPDPDPIPNIGVV